MEISLNVFGECVFVQVVDQVVFVRVFVVVLVVLFLLESLILELEECFF